jgi:putative peptide zinc metalloprotease protein
MRWGGRRLALAAVVACGLPAGAAVAQGDDQRPARNENRAVATVEADGRRAFDFAWALERERAGVVDHKNIANAAARCSDCRAAAIAFQIVIVVGKPAQIVPRNQAVAINDQCTRCVVYAGARQFVRIVENPVRFTDEGRSTLESVRRELRRLEGQDLTAGELGAAVEAQEARVKTVLTEELVEIEGGRRGHVLDRQDRRDDDG